MSFNFNKINTVYKIISCLVVVLLCSLIFILSNQQSIKVISLVLCLFSVLILIIYEKIVETYIKNIFIKLSNMLDQVNSLKDDIEFECYSEDLLSKINLQVNKIRKLMISQNNRIESEQDEIKALISDIAHQLKTPLSNLKMYGEFIENDDLSVDERKEFTSIMISAVDRLSFLIESLIKLSRLEGGVIRLNNKNMNIIDTILDCMNQVRVKASKKKINIKIINIDNIILNYDNKWMKEAVFNILDNAVKYSYDSTDIIIDVVKYDMYCKISISNEGISISEEEYPKIFTRFYRSKNSSDVEGIGIGLYLSRKIVSYEGGYIKVKSKGNRTEFSILLPINNN